MLMYSDSLVGECGCLMYLSRNDVPVWGMLFLSGNDVPVWE